MTYSKQPWVNTSGSTSGGLSATGEVNAERMNYIEDGVEAAALAADGAATAADVADASAADTAYTDAAVAALEIAMSQLLGRPTRPKNLTVTLGTTTVTLTWDASIPPPGGSTTNYRVFKNGVVVAASVGTTATTYTVTGLTMSTPYDFYVVPSNATGDGPQSDTVTATTLAAAVPTIPTGLQATSWTDTRVDVAWTASTSPSGPVTGYKVFRDGSQIGTTTTALTYADTGRSASTAYVYTVKASNAAGDSAASDPVTVTTLAGSPVPGVRGTFSAVPTTTSQPFTATLPAGILSGDVGYVMLTDNNATDTPTSVVSPSGAWTLRSGPILSGTSTQRAWLYRKDSMSGADASATLTITLTGGTRFGCVGIVLSSATAADDALVSWATTPTGSTAFDIAAITPTVANTRLVLLSLARFTQTTGNQYNLPADWTVPVNVRSAHGTSPQVGGLVAHQVLGAAAAHGPQGASDGASFNALASEIAFEFTVAPVAAATPSVPLNPHVIAVDTTSVTYAWDAPATVPTGSPVTNYKVYSSTGTLLTTLPASQLTYQRTGLTSGQTVGFSVSAVNSAGEGPATAKLTTTTATLVRFAGDPGIGKMMIGQASSEMTCAAFDKRVFPGATVNDPPTKRFKLNRAYNGSSVLLLDTARKNDLKADSAAGRITVLSWMEGSYTHAQVAAGAADADITANATFLRDLGTPVWWAYHHEPDNGDVIPKSHTTYASITATDKTASDNYRKAYRRQINIIHSIATNVAFFSPFYVGGIWDDTPGGFSDWRWYHPNFDGEPTAGGVWLSDGPFGGSWVNGDGIDMYNPNVHAAQWGSSVRNQNWETKAQQFLTRRTNDGGRELPWVIGELGTYNWLATLDDNGVTNQIQDHDMITIGAATEGLVGVCFWNNAYAGFNDTYDPYPTVGARTAALRTEINANLSIVVMG